MFFEWHQWNRKRTESSYITVPCTQGSCYVVGYDLYRPIPYLISLCRHLWLLLEVVSSGRSPFLRCMDGGSWNWGTVRWMLVYGIRISLTLALFEIFEHPGMGVYFYFLSPLWTVSKVLLCSHGPVESEHLPGVARVWSRLKIFEQTRNHLRFVMFDVNKSERNDKNKLNSLSKRTIMLRFHKSDSTFFIFNNNHFWSFGRYQNWN